jgi:hypothetical protein
MEYGASEESRDAPKRWLLSHLLTKIWRHLFHLLNSLGKSQSYSDGSGGYYAVSQCILQD